MALKALFPALSIVGVAGGISSAIGLSIFSPPQVSTPKYKYKIEIPKQISAGIDCSGKMWKQNVRDVDEDVEIKFEWKVDLNDDDLEKIKSGQEVSKNATVSINRKNGERWDWWSIIKEYGPGSMWVSTDSGGRSLSVTVQASPLNNGRNKIWDLGREKSKGLSCEANNILVSQSLGKRIFSQQTRAKGWRDYSIVDGSKNLEVRITNGQCKDMKENQIDCSLKVITSNDLDWSSKVSQKAKIELE